MRKKVLEINHPLYEKKQTYWEYSSSQYMLTKKTRDSYEPVSLTL